MSGIAAILYLDGRRASQADINRVVRPLSAYGPERQSTSLVGPVAFAYAQFSDTPETHGRRQPVTGGAGRFSMVFDGRLDNRDQLAVQLDLERHRLVVLSDAELAILCWEHWGHAAVNHWVGEFAFVLWDKVEKKLTAARDQFGARTLHYNFNSNRLILASAPKCIHALGDLPREIDEQKIADALCQLYHDGERTFFKGVKRIAPAAMVTFSNGALRTRKYYDLRENVHAIRYKSDDEYVEAARELFETSVRATLRTSGPVGAFLSGGLDSSTMAAVAARVLEEKGKNLITYTSIPEEGWDQRSLKGFFGDESPFVRDIATQIPSLETNFIDGAGIGQYHKQEELLLALELPVRNALNLQWTHAILEQAKTRGVSVMLQGAFGNATLSHTGDGIFGEYLCRGALFPLVNELRAISKGSRHFVRNTFKHLVFPLGPNWLWSTKERLRGHLPPDQNWQRFSTVASEFAAEMNIADRIKDAGYSYTGSKPEYSRPLWFNMIDNFMTETGDILQGLRSMYGIDIRDPFADRRLVEWSFGVPERQFFRNGVNRWLIRRMMIGQIPDSVLQNKKLGLQTADWHVRLSRDLPAMRRDLDLIAEDRDLSRMVNVEMVRNLLDDWPGQTVTDLDDDRFFQLPVLLPMTLQIARFVQREKGTNTQF